VIADPTVARGGCVVSSELGRIDAQVEVQLARMAELLGCDPP
jgi:flagellar assembly protein FliH